MNDRYASCLTRWLPVLEAAGIPTPKTEVVRAGERWRELVSPLWDRPYPDFFENFCFELMKACRKVSPAGPWFLRTGQTSAKHFWKQACFVTDPAEIGKHVMALVEFSELADPLGLPYDVFAVREYLPVEPVAVLPNYNDMPLVPERRYFVRGGAVVCSHDYWPTKAIEQGLKRPAKGEDFTPLDAQLLALRAAPGDDRLAAFDALALRVAAAFAGDGAWSVDVLATKAGPYVTDMARAEISYHWDGCEHAASFGGGA